MNISPFFKYLVAVLLLFFLFKNDVYATHNKAGEITYTHAPIPGQQFRFQIQVFTYTRIDDSQSLLADRDSLEVFWGDGTNSTILRSNGPTGVTGVPNGVPIDERTKLNVYTGTHTYPGDKEFYVISMRDPNRISDIINISFGASVDIEFYLEDTLFLPNTQFFGFNNSPILFQPPIDFGEVGEIFIHNPNAFDVDGDSLHFELIPPKSAGNTDVPNYQYPNEVMPGPDNIVTLDAQTGEFVWNTPQQVGIYNVAFLIREFRNGLEIGNMIRDMQIEIFDTDNQPPEIAELNDTCIFLGDELNITVTAIDPDIPPQQVSLTAFGGPLELDVSPATFIGGVGSGSVEGNFSWQTVCEHVFSTEYSVVFKAEDNFVFQGNPIPLVDLETWLISVVAPPPTGLQASIQGGNILLTWDSPYVCSDSDKFYGFSVWRKEGCTPEPFDKCQQGLDGSSYTLLAQNLTDFEYLDLTAARGVVYTYRIVAQFADVFTTGNFPLNVASSVPSDGVCIDMPRDVPVITHASVENTSAIDGEIFVAWVRPNPIDLDTTLNLPPYRYEILRSEGLNGANFIPIQTFTANNFSDPIDTTFLDTGLNTIDTPYSYKINFYVENDVLLGATEIASSVFLSTSPTDNQSSLTWEENVPWTNTEYVIYRSVTGLNGVYDSIGVTTEPFYNDSGLTNGKEYCYYIKAIGTYFTDELPNPLINLSQRKCEVPEDNIPPCAPELTVENDCDENSEIEGDDFNQNRLDWTNPNLTCTDDVLSYNIYFSSPQDTGFVLLETIDGAENTFYAHTLTGSLAGCYAVAAVDSFNNESVYSNVVCKESCLIYELPNVFTPNFDNMNDLLVPRESRFVSSIDIKIFNRWGNLVYETNDPLINWDGTNLDSGKEVSEGVYFYTCDVFERSSTGLEVVGLQLSGYVHVLRE